MQTVHVNMVNEVISCKANVIEPKVGMLGTYFVGSDRYAVVVCKIFSPKKIFVQFLRDDNITKRVVDGIEYWGDDAEQLMKSNQPNENNPDFDWQNTRFWKEGTYTLRKNGRWIEQGRGLWECGAIHLGIADPYLDPSF